MGRERKRDRDTQRKEEAPARAVRIRDADSMILFGSLFLESFKKYILFSSRCQTAE